MDRTSNVPNKYCDICPYVWPLLNLLRKLAMKLETSYIVYTYIRFIDTFRQQLYDRCLPTDHEDLTNKLFI